MPPRNVFISWISYSRRSQLIADKLGLRLYLISSLKRKPYLAPLRYLLQSVRTLFVLLRDRPAVVFVQNPPFYAPLVVYLYCLLFRRRFVIDVHSTALMLPLWRWSLPWHGFLSRQALTTIVTNEHHAGTVRAWGAPVFILADIPAELPASRPFAMQGSFCIAVVNTFAPDEPLDTIVQAAAGLPDVQFYITGDPFRARKALMRDAPPNVCFTGFLPDEDYLGLLRAAQAVMVLTTRDHTMQRGACEAVALGKPIITSNWGVLRSYFHRGTVHVDNTCAGIQAGVRQMQQEFRQLEQDIRDLQVERRQEWRVKEAQLAALLQAAGGSD
jgi:glycosyltransferase involved in cell wall biosynthesis